MIRNSIIHIAQKGVSACLAVLLIVSFIAAPIGQSLSIQKVESQTAPTPPSQPPANPPIPSQRPSTPSAGLSVPVADLALQFQEYVLDQLAWDIAKMAISSITDSIVNWINSGFEGNPAFVTNLERYLLDIVDQVIGEFIYGSDLAFLCSPFQLEVRIALALAYYQPYGDEARCTLSDVVSNIEGFFAGAYDPRGWESWFAIATNPHNNPYGALFEADAELSIRIANAAGERLTLLEWGDGFLSEEDCEDEDDSLGCFIINPGSVIEGQLEHALGSGIRQLELADEINEIVGALVGYLARELLTGGGGLFGLSGGGSYAGGSFTIPTRPGGGSSYTDRIGDERNAQVIETQNEAIGLIAGSLAEETAYRAIKRQTLGSAERAGDALERLRLCHAEAGTGSAAAIANRIASEIEPVEANLERDIDESLANSAKLSAIETDIRNAFTSEDIQAGVGRFLSILSSLNGRQGVSNASAERGAVGSAMDGAAAQAQRDVDALQNDPVETNSSDPDSKPETRNRCPNLPSSVERNGGNTGAKNKINIGEIAEKITGRSSHEKINVKQSPGSAASQNPLNIPRNATYEEGIAALRNAAELRNRKYSYYFVQEADGDTYWQHSGTGDAGSAVARIEVLNPLSNDPIARIYNIHTHPRSITQTDSAPPSLYDIGATRDLTDLHADMPGRPEIIVEAVDVRNVWRIVDISNFDAAVNRIEERTILRSELEAEVRALYGDEFQNLLGQERIYVCGYYQACGGVTAADREAAIAEALRIYRSMGIEIRRRPL